VRLVHPVKGPQAPVRIEVITGLGPRAPAPNPRVRAGSTRRSCCSSLLCDVGELLSQPLSVVEVAVQRELARRHVEARLEPPRGRVPSGDACAGRVLPVEMADDVAAPGEFRGLPCEVEQRLDLRQPGGLSVADEVDAVPAVARRKRPGTLVSGQLELDVHRLPDGEIVVEKDAWEPPADLARGAVPQ